LTGTPLHSYERYFATFYTGPLTIDSALCGKGGDGIHAYGMTLYGKVAKGWGSPYPVIH
jgi:hypothetical protein